MTLPLFVYGTLRPGARHHDRLLLGRTATEEDALLPGALLHDGPGHPYAVPGEGTVRGSLVTPVPEAYGELLDSLDRLEYGAGYERTALDTVRAGDGAAVRAWVYLAAPGTPVGPLIASGDWFSRAPDAPRTP
ncbi:gamma-glutamylcyclotransferase family protein [Streptomyces roseolus]|uniref:gamma-glutamylcyclotransferase family protein n=1 Tax=Streptomyces roseolus TaxID=67358 RepID=UPI00365BEF96